MYMVGGYVRDEILGVPSKDIDYTVVLEDGDMLPRRTKSGKMVNDSPFDVMVSILESKGFRIFLKTREHLTVRAQFPRYQGSTTLIRSGSPAMTADFVLARKEGKYSDGRRPDSVEPGTLEDDLARRDFTMNAVAKDTDGNYIDPFNGRADIETRVIRAVGDPYERLTEDALRAVRALRFSVTKGFRLDDDLYEILGEYEIAELVRTKIADERISDELSKMFRFDTVASIDTLFRFPLLTEAMFSGSISLDSTMKTRGRGRA